MNNPTSFGNVSTCVWFFDNDVFGCEKSANCLASYNSWLYSVDYIETILYKLQSTNYKLVKRETNDNML